MKNIFENTYFGKPYKTRKGQKAIYLGQSEKYENAFEFAYYDYELDVRYNEDIDKITGKAIETPDGYQTNCDIISEWHEEINEEELDKLAEEYIQGFDYAIEISPNLLSLKKDRALAKSVFKAGFRARGNYCKSVKQNPNDYDTRRNNKGMV